MKVISMKKNKTLTIDLTEEEIDILLEYAINNILREKLAEKEN